MGVENGLRMVKSSRSPYPSVATVDAGFTLKPEVSDARAVEIAFKSPRYKAVNKKVHVRAFLASDSAGDNITQVAPDSLTIGLSADGVMTKGTLAKSVTAEKFKTTTKLVYSINGATYTKDATDNLVFSAAHVVAAGKYGVALIQIDAAGTVSTKVPAATQTYTSAAKALAALPAPDASHVAIGYITLDNSTSQGSGAGGLWTANTDDITDTGDITAAALVDASEVSPTGNVHVSVGDGGPGLLAIGTLAISATAEKFKTTTTAYYEIGGKIFSKAATDNLVFSAAHVVAAAKYGIVLVQIDAAGAITTKVPGATPTTPMAYADAATALAALPAPDPGKVSLGYITLDNSASDGSTAGAWTANTDDLTNTSDITAAAFVDGVIIGCSREFTLGSDASGNCCLIITTTQVVTYYLVLIMPDGTRVVSPAIAFT